MPRAHSLSRVGQCCSGPESARDLVRTSPEYRSAHVAEWEQDVGTQREYILLGCRACLYVPVSRRFALFLSHP